MPTSRPTNTSVYVCLSGSTRVDKLCSWSACCIAHCCYCSECGWSKERMIIDFVSLLCDHLRLSENGVSCNVAVRGRLTRSVWASLRLVVVLPAEGYCGGMHMRVPCVPHVPRRAVQFTVNLIQSLVFKNCRVVKGLKHVDSL